MASKGSRNTCSLAPESLCLGKVFDLSELSYCRQYTGLQPSVSIIFPHNVALIMMNHWSRGTHNETQPQRNHSHFIIHTVTSSIGRFSRARSHTTTDTTEKKVFCSLSKISTFRKGACPFGTAQSSVYMNRGQMNPVFLEEAKTSTSPQRR